VAAHCDMWRWENNLYSTQFKAYVLTWYDLHMLVEANQKDAEAQKQERDARRKS